MEILIVGITTQDIIVTITKNMVISLKIALRNTSEVIKTNGFMILYALVVLRPIM